MKDLTPFKINALYKRVVNEIIKDSKTQGKATREEKLKARLNDIFKHPLLSGSGIVSSLIYSDDITKFYQRYKKQISELLYEILDGTDLSIDKLFVDKWDSTDPLALDYNNQELLAWFAYQEIASRLSDYLEEEE